MRLGRALSSQSSRRSATVIFASGMARPSSAARRRLSSLWRASVLVRAETARVLAALKFEPARFPLEERLTDRHWLVRANAAFALQRISNRISRRALGAALSEKDARAWIAICDAFAWFGGRSPDATSEIVPRLKHRLWQVRLTAARALRRVGTSAALDVLIERFREEHLRVVESETRAAFGNDLDFSVKIVDVLPALANAKHRDYIRLDRRP